MRTEQQVKRKLNELTMQRQGVLSRLDALLQSGPDAEAGTAAPLQAQLEQLESMIVLLEWVLNEPTGAYHA